MRYQPSDPTDISCGVQALGMALDGLDGAGPASSALLSFLQENGLLYEWGTGVEELAFTAAAFGYDSARPFHGGSLADLTAELAAGRPVVVALGANGEGVPGHFVTVTGSSADGEWVSYNDPVLGAQTVHRAVFDALWARQGRAGVHFASHGAPAAGDTDALPWLAFAAGLMALVSTSPLGTRRKGIGGRLLDGGGSLAAASQPPYPAPAGKRWVSKLVPQYTTRRVRAGWKTVEERVPITKTVRYQAETRTVHQRVPKYRTVRVRDGYRRVPHRVPVYRSRRYVRYYRTSWRRVGWRWVRRRVPVYGTRRVRVGSRTVWRSVPNYVTKRVFDGYRTVTREVPVYKTKEVVTGYKTVEKQVPRYVNQRVKMGERVEWKLVDKPRRTSSSGGQGGLARVVPSEDPNAAVGDSGEGEVCRNPRRPSSISAAIWASLTPEQKCRIARTTSTGHGTTDRSWQPPLPYSDPGPQVESLLNNLDSEFHATIDGTYIGNNPYAIDDSYGPEGSPQGLIWSILGWFGVANALLANEAYGRYLNSQPVNVTGQISYSTNEYGTLLKELIVDNHADGPLKATVDIVTSNGMKGQLETRWLTIGASEIPIPNHTPNDIGQLSPDEAATITVTLYAAYNDPPIFRYITFQVPPYSETDHATDILED